MMECVVCGMMFDASVGQCPKCDTHIKEMFVNAILDLKQANFYGQWSVKQS